MNVKYYDGVCIYALIAWHWKNTYKVPHYVHIVDSISCIYAVSVEISQLYVGFL
jgi:hypothetical protein